MAWVMVGGQSRALDEGFGILAFNASRLSVLVLWVTLDCNLRCRYCYADGGNRTEYMRWQVAKRALDVMRGRSRHFKIQFAGGEPLLNMDLIEQVVNYTRHLGLTYQLQTNATLINARLAEKLKRLGIKVGISLDGLPIVNDSLRPFPDGRSSTNAAITGLENLGAVGIGVGLTCVLSAENVAGLTGLVELASYLGNVEGIAFDCLRPIGRAKEGHVEPADPALVARYVKAALERADELALIGGKRVKFREAERLGYRLLRGLKRKHRCDACQYLVIDPRGEAYPCPSLASFPEFHLGNIMAPTFADRLSADLKRCRQLLTPPHRCLECDQYWLCTGPCPAQTYAQRLTGRAEPVEPTECLVKRTFISFINRRKEAIDHAAEDQVGLSV
jgi:uncharacterized protein